MRPVFAQRVVIAAGSYPIGSDAHYAEERPARRLDLEAFAIEATPVTNAAFAAFVADTGWITEAERAEPAGSGVFVASQGPIPLNDPSRWWRFAPGACWQSPSGPGSDLTGKDDHPVVHVSKADAAAYAAWRGLDLPTEAQWEAAARGGLAMADYAWGDEFQPTEHLMANVWTGAFPWWFARGPEAGTSCIGAYPANGYGLFDMIGNVWEWTRSPFTDDPAKGCCSGTGAKDAGLFTLKGGSFLCAAEYCERYRPAARMGLPANTSMAHIGFRCASPA